MTTKVKLAALAGALVLIFAVAVGAGAVTSGDDREEPAKPMAGHEEDAGTYAGADTGATHPVRGLAVADEGLRLVLDTPELRRGARGTLRFRIAGEDGEALRDFDVEHEKRMHLILARRDLTGFQHLHPVQKPGGTWEADVVIEKAGSYRVFADFNRAGEPHTLASDLRVDGAADLRDLPRSEPLADAGDGYQVRIDADATPAGDPSQLSFTIHRNGRAVHTEPYLGAGGHLVALREGDMAFLHVHPVERAHGGTSDAAIAFQATFPTPARYRLFLQFRHAGEVHTAEFTHDVA